VNDQPKFGWAGFRLNCVGDFSWVHPCVKVPHRDQFSAAAPPGSSAAPRGKEPHRNGFGLTNISGAPWRHDIPSAASSWNSMRISLRRRRITINIAKLPTFLAAQPAEEPSAQEQLLRFEPGRLSSRRHSR